jgi:hypothetical protein
LSVSVTCAVSQISASHYARMLAEKSVTGLRACPGGMRRCSEILVARSGRCGDGGDCGRCRVATAARPGPKRLLLVNTALVVGETCSGVVEAGGARLLPIDQRDLAHPPVAAR